MGCSRGLWEAMPLPAMSNAVPWSTEVRTIGSPSVTLYGAGLGMLIVLQSTLGLGLGLEFGLGLGLGLGLEEVFVFDSKSENS